MESTFNRILHWTPRVLAILFILFLSLFALDVFSEGYAWWELLVALFMHLIPSLALLVVLGIAWRWPGLGGLLFLAIATAFLVGFRLYEEWVNALLIAGPPVLVGALFLFDWNARRTKLKTT